MAEIPDVKIEDKPKKTKETSEKPPILKEGEPLQQDKFTNPNPNLEGPITEPQRKKLWAIMYNELKLDKESAKGFYDAVNPKTKASASTFIEKLEKGTTQCPRLGDPNGVIEVAACATCNQTSNCVAWG